MSETGLQEIVCCLGDAVAGNPSQYVIEKAFAALDLDNWRCLTLRVAPGKLADALAGVKAMGIRGVHLAGSLPVASMSLLEEIAPIARRAGRCDVAMLQGDRLVGDDLLGASVLAAFGPTFVAKDKRATVLGAGGMARSAIAALSAAGAASIEILARHPGRGEALLDVVKNEMGARAKLVIWNGVVDVDEETDLLLNCTSASGETKLPLALAALRPGTLVADVAVNPPDSWLLREARARGLQTVDGVEILLAQVEALFRRWTGVEPPDATMREALEEFLGV